MSEMYKNGFIVKNKKGKETSSDVSLINYKPDRRIGRMALGETC